MHAQYNFYRSKLPPFIETAAERFAFHLSGGEKAALDAGTRHKKSGSILKLLSVFAVLMGFKIAGLLALVLVFCTLASWAVFFLGQNSLDSQQKSARRFFALEATAFFLTQSFRNACRSAGAKLSFKVVLFFALAIATLERLFVSLGGLPHPAISDRILHIPIAVR